ncbi:hypothetical protein HPP92_005656 [Vanilla planifolia]|uniref:Aspartic proteinase Asp1 n=1 Tax=Vanilla planifolia TaxID=51239 RepID=A0A835RUB0_VANPL|nr:hypothetical protein HPP92_005656 [Vanilla planifolia]
MPVSMALNSYTLRFHLNVDIACMANSCFKYRLYYVTIGIGNPPKPYFLDVDTGSDLTWVQCDAPASAAPRARTLYKPTKNRLVPCKDPICAAVQESTSHEGRGCQTPDQCDYEIEYQDQGHSRGVLVTDFFAFRLRNSTVVRPSLVFGCGYDQHGEHSATDGVLGLGFGKASIPSQLRDLGVCRNVMGHCLGRQRAGFLFFGDDVVRPQTLTWAPISRIGQHNYYSPGQATVNAGKQLLASRQTMVFDSGSSYTYFSNHLLQSVLSAINNDVSKTSLKPEPEENALPNCWKATTPFESVLDLKKYFRTLILGFGGKAPAVMEIPPENYFIVTKQGNACLGILDGSREGLGDLNLIGDISMQDLVVVYDNERQRIGWARVAGCDLSKSAASSLDDSFVLFLWDDLSITGGGGQQKPIITISFKELLVFADFIDHPKLYKPTSAMK